VFVGFLPARYFSRTGGLQTGVVLWLGTRQVLLLQLLQIYYRPNLPGFHVMEPMPGQRVIAVARLPALGLGQPDQSGLSTPRLIAYTDSAGVKPPRA
jgi:hypothetical protein